MAETATLNVQQNGYRNVIITGSLVSNGTGITDQKIYDASSGGSYGVVKAGQTFYPGVHTTIVGLDFDVQGMQFKLSWEGSPSNQDIMAFGASPEDFNWSRFGGIRVPSGLAGATGSILLNTIAAAANATLFFAIYLRKNVPVT